MQIRARQRGWAGLIGLLIALLIVFLLGKTVLQQMGLLTAAPKPPTAVAAPGNVQSTTATPAPIAPLEHARALESQVRQQASENMQRIDKAAQ